jgi:hypothetical protein
MENAALLKFDAQRTLNRVGMTYVIDIGFTSHDPDKSARLVNALADAYIDDQLDAKFQATRRASIWLQERISELRTQATFRYGWRKADRRSGSCRGQQPAHPRPRRNRGRGTSRPD